MASTSYGSSSTNNSEEENLEVIAATLCSMASTSYGSSSGNNSSVFDIFINHRGPDSKKTLAKHLYHRLKKEGLRVFLDEDELQAGEYIIPQIHSAIQTASVHIAIFSPRYADSNWCLDELLLMFESGSTIIPVFYGVEPADLRWGTRDEKRVYGRSLQTLEKKRTFDSQPRYDYNTIQKWRKALFDAAEIKGFDMKTYNGDEQQLLEQVVEAVLKKVKRPLHVSTYPIGLDEKVAEFERVMLLHQQSSRETLSAVRENVARNSLKSIQSMILSGLAQVNVQIGNTADGIEKLKSYLKSSYAFLSGLEVEKLQTIDLSQCSRVPVLPNSFGELRNLKSLHLFSWSGLKVLPDSFGNLSNLQTIEVSYCSSLRVLADSFGNLQNLKSIDLSYSSRLQVLPDSFGNLQNLETIDLSYSSRLQVLPDSFGNLTNLQTRG